MEIKKIEPRTMNSMRLVKSEDLNHHGTLFAGRSAEWFVEAGFIAATTLLDPKWVVCMKIHGMHFSSPVRPGEIINFESKIVYTGRSTLFAHIKAVRVALDENFVEGFITFVHVDENTKAKPHLIEIVPVSDYDKELQRKAIELKTK